jgi:hypothetical protein
MEEAKKLEEKVQAFDKLKDMEQRVEDLENELHWAIVYEIEAVCCLVVCCTLVHCQQERMAINILSSVHFNHSITYTHARMLKNHVLIN